MQRSPSLSPFFSSSLFPLSLSLSLSPPPPQWAYDNVTAEYCLSLQRKRKGHSIKLPSNKGKVPAERREKLTSAAEASAGGSARNLLRVAHDTPTFGSSLNLAGSGENLHLAAVRVQLARLACRLCFLEARGSSDALLCCCCCCHAVLRAIPSDARLD